MKILKEIKKELKKYYDPDYQKGSQRFFKEDVKVFGVRYGNARKVAKQMFNKDWSKKEVFDHAEELLKEEILEIAVVAVEWVRKKESEFKKRDFKRFESWTKKYIHNWATCDDFCTHPFGFLLMSHPELFSKVKVWTRSKNRWVRRASAVIMIHPVARGKMLKESFVIADILLEDKDDMVQKGYGWMLKVASDKFSKEVFDFVMKRKAKMPRTSLRYAIEKYPKEKRKQAMAR